MNNFSKSITLITLVGIMSACASITVPTATNAWAAEGTAVITERDRVIINSDLRLCKKQASAKIQSQTLTSLDINDCMADKGYLLTQNVYSIKK